MYPYLCPFKNRVMPMAHRIQVLNISLIEPCIFSVKIYTCTIYEIHEKKANTCIYHTSMLQIFKQSVTYYNCHP